MAIKKQAKSPAVETLRRTMTQPAFLDSGQSILDRARSLVSELEIVRSTVIPSLIAEAFLTGGASSEEILSAAYGGDPAQYWTVFMSEPLHPNVFAHGVALHLANSVGSLSTMHNAMVQTLLDLSEIKDPACPVSDLVVVSRSSHGDQIVGPKIDPESVLRWLWTKPKRRHMVPKTLARALHQSDKADDSGTSSNLTIDLSTGHGQVAENYRSGAPGRPTSMQLVENKMLERFHANELLSSMSQEAGWLEHWLKTEHKLAPPLKAKTIKNTLGSLFRTLLVSPEKKISG